VYFPLSGQAGWRLRIGQWLGRGASCRREDSSCVVCEAGNFLNIQLGERLQKMDTLLNIVIWSETMKEWLGHRLLVLNRFSSNTWLDYVMEKSDKIESNISPLAFTLWDTAGVQFEVIIEAFCTCPGLLFKFLNFNSFWQAPEPKTGTGAYEIDKPYVSEE